MNETSLPRFSKIHRSDKSWKTEQQWIKDRDRGSRLQHPAGLQLCPWQAVGAPVTNAIESELKLHGSLALQESTNGNWVWWTSNTFPFCWYLKLACPLVWRQLEPWWNPLLMDIHALQKAGGQGGFRHWHTWTMCFNGLLAVGRTPSWGSAGFQWHLHHKEVPSTPTALR